jgi:hypothetical protein
MHSTNMADTAALPCQLILSALHCRESDIEKLSFAVELAQAFFADVKACSRPHVAAVATEGKVTCVTR